MQATGEESLARFFSTTVPSLGAFLGQHKVAGLRRLWRKMGRAGPFCYDLASSILPPYAYWFLYEPEAAAACGPLTEEQRARFQEHITPEALDDALARAAAHTSARRLDPEDAAALLVLAPGQDVPMLYIQGCLMLLDAELGLPCAAEHLAHTLQLLEGAGRGRQAALLAESPPAPAWRPRGAARWLGCRARSRWGMQRGGGRPASWRLRQRPAC